MSSRPNKTDAHKRKLVPFFLPHDIYYASCRSHPTDENASYVAYNVCDIQLLVVLTENSVPSLPAFGALGTPQPNGAPR